MDGVLVDNRDIHIEAFVIFCKRHGIAMDKEEILPLFGKGNDEIIPAVMKKDFPAEELQILSDEKEEIYREIFAERIQPTPGLIPLLAELKKQNIKIAVGSSGMQKNIDFVLEKCRITKYFDAIANGDIITKAKPDPEVFLLAAKLLNTPPSECLVFEDSFAGIEAERRAGMPVIALATTFSRERLANTGYDMIIDDFSEINASDIIKEKWKNNF